MGERFHSYSERLMAMSSVQKNMERRSICYEIPPLREHLIKEQVQEEELTGNISSSRTPYSQDYPIFKTNELLFRRFQILTQQPTHCSDYYEKRVNRNVQKAFLTGEITSLRNGFLFGFDEEGYGGIYDKISTRELEEECYQYELSLMEWAKEAETKERGNIISFLDRYPIDPIESIQLHARELDTWRSAFISHYGDEPEF